MKTQKRHPENQVAEDAPGFDNLLRTMLSAPPKPHPKPEKKAAKKKTSK